MPAIMFLLGDFDAVVSPEHSTLSLILRPDLTTIITNVLRFFSGGVFCVSQAKHTIVR